MREGKRKRNSEVAKERETKDIDTMRDTMDRQTKEKES